MEGRHFGAGDAQGYNSNFLYRGVPIASAARCFALIPAAGVGARLGASLPKQYLEIGGRAMLDWSVAALLDAAWISRVLVVVAPDDRRGAALLAGRDRVEVLAAGGATRADTVRAGLRRLADSGALPGQWVLVHDAARPAIERAWLERLRAGVGDDRVGGLLALPVSDTVKRAGADGLRVRATLGRERLWLAQTPQMFRLGLLADALAAFPAVTDEAAALECAGHAPRLIEGARANFKVTTAEDLELMRRLLEQRGQESR